MPESVTMVDERPEIAPEFFGYRPLPAENDLFPLVSEMVSIQREAGATWFRATYINDEHPHPPYPHGVYLEGWKIAPHLSGGTGAPFSYPLTAALEERADG